MARVCSIKFLLLKSSDLRADTLVFVFILTCLYSMISCWKATEVALFPGQSLFDKVLVRKLHKQGLGWGVGLVENSWLVSCDELTIKLNFVLIEDFVSLNQGLVLALGGILYLKKLLLVTQHLVCGFRWIRTSDLNILQAMGTGGRDEEGQSKLRRPLSSSYSTAFLPMREGTRTMQVFTFPPFQELEPYELVERDHFHTASPRTM